MRPTSHPRAALVFGADIAPPSDWPIIEDFDACDSELRHALGWACEIRSDGVLLINPLGEGVVKAPLPAFSAAWLDEMQAHSTAAIYLLDRELGGDAPASAVNAAARRGGLPAATVRTAKHESFGRAAPVGRNEPCPCGSGRKYKACHGRSAK